VFLKRGGLGRGVFKKGRVGERCFQNGEGWGEVFLKWSRGDQLLSHEGVFLIPRKVGFSWDINRTAREIIDNAYIKNT
jgi:hypothetical protein